MKRLLAFSAALLFSLNPTALTVQDVVTDMTLPNSANGENGYPHGVPTSWDWYSGPVMHSPLPPDGWTAFIPWGVIYRDLADSPDSNTRVAIRRIKGYILDKTDSTWNLVSDGAAGGSFYEEDISSNNSIPFSTRRIETDSSVSALIPHGYTWHFFPDNRASIDPDRVAGVFTVYSARLILDSASKTDDRAYARYLMQAGADWWQSLSAPYPANAGVGGSRFDYITTEWTDITLTTLTTAQLAANPPPGVDTNSVSVEAPGYPLPLSCRLRSNGSASPVISGLPDHARVEVFDMAGRCRTHQLVRSGDSAFFRSCGAGIFVVRIGREGRGGVFKVVVLK